jgi:pyridoxamine 5'-phosphate oxidase
MLGNACVFSDEPLPEPLPPEPMGVFMEWLTLATSQRTQPNPNAMTLATVDASGQPSARVVLARRVDVDRGYVVFFTNYKSRKGQEIGVGAGGKVALCFHWDQLDRQVRIEGLATLCPAAESDAYFGSRPVLSRIAAWASDQSEAIESRAALLAKNDAAEERFGWSAAADAAARARLVVPRPGHWGGYRVWASRVELWRGHTNRLHDRAVYERTLTPASVDGVAGFIGGAWGVRRLQP